MIHICLLIQFHTIVYIDTASWCIALFKNTRTAPWSLQKKTINIISPTVSYKNYLTNYICFALQTMHSFHYSFRSASYFLFELFFASYTLYIHYNLYLVHIPVIFSHFHNTYTCRTHEQINANKSAALHSSSVFEINVNKFIFAQKLFLTYRYDFVHHAPYGKQGTRTLDIIR